MCTLWGLAMTDSLCNPSPTPAHMFLHLCVYPLQEHHAPLISPPLIMQTQCIAGTTQKGQVNIFSNISLWRSFTSTSFPSASSTSVPALSSFHWPRRFPDVYFLTSGHFDVNLSSVRWWYTLFSNFVTFLNVLSSHLPLPWCKLQGLCHGWRVFVLADVLLWHVCLTVFG